MIPTEELTSAELNSIIGDWAGATKDYVEDLNAVHEAILQLPKPSRNRFEVELSNIILGGTYFANGYSHGQLFPLISASARQRCIALVKIIKSK